WLQFYQYHTSIFDLYPLVAINHIGLTILLPQSPIKSHTIYWGMGEFVFKREKRSHRTIGMKNLRTPKIVLRPPLLILFPRNTGIKCGKQVIPILIMMYFGCPYHTSDPIVRWSHEYCIRTFPCF